MENSHAQFRGLVSSRGLGEAFLALTKAGVRDRKMLEEFTPVIDMLATATGEDPGGLAHTLYRLTDAYGFTRDQAVAYMLTLKKVAAETATGLGTLQEQMKENLEGGLGAFLQTVKTPEVRKTILENFAKVTGALVNQWGDTGGMMAKQVSDALTDPRAAAKLSRFLGMQQGELMATLQREGGAEEIVRSLSDTIQRNFGKGGDVSSSLAIFKEAFDFEGNVAELQRLILSGEKFEKQAAALAGTTVKTADAMNGLKDATDNAKGGWTEFKDSVGTWITGNIPPVVLEFLGDFNLQAITSAAHLASLAIEFVATGIKALFFGGVQSATTITVAGTTVAIQTQNKSLLVSTLRLGKNAAAWVIAKGVMLGTIIVTKAVTAAQILWNLAMSANPIGLIVIGVAALIAAIVFLVKNWETVKSVTAFVFRTIGEWIMKAFDWIAGFGDKLLFLLGPIGAIIFVVKNFGEIWDWLKEKVMGVWDFIVSGISAGIEGVKGIFGSIIGFLMAPLEIVKGFINKWIIGPLNEVVKIDLPLVGPLQDFKLAARIFPLPTLEHGGIAYGPTVAVVGEVPEAIIPLDKLKGVFAGMAEELRQVFLHPLLTARDIEDAIMVKMDPDATDEPVLNAIQEQTAVLMDILAQARAGGPIIVPAVAAGGGARGGRGASATTRGMAGGDF